MKVGIITFNRAINYGAVLQSYALKKTIEEMGHQCQVINYKCDIVEKGASPFYINSMSVKDILIFLMQIRMRMCKNKKFKEFTDKYLDTDNPVIDSSSINTVRDKYDLLITGSDQVWNYEITGLDENYFLKFASDKTKKISYAASFGVAEIPQLYREKYKELLSDIDTISVREDTGRCIVKELTGKDSIILIDPVFLQDKNKWEKISEKPDIKGDYVLVYSINHTDSYKIAEKISADKNIPVVGLQTPMSNRTKCRIIRTESPTEFLGWINNARYVVTDSFHGTAFSVIFEKQFVLCGGGESVSRNSRQKNLLNTLGLSSQICSFDDYDKIYKKIDYSSVKAAADKEKDAALLYLKNEITQ